MPPEIAAAFERQEQCRNGTFKKISFLAPNGQLVEDISASRVVWTFQVPWALNLSSRTGRRVDHTTTSMQATMETSTVTDAPATMTLVWTLLGARSHDRTPPHAEH